MDVLIVEKAVAVETVIYEQIGRLVKKKGELAVITSTDSTVHPHLQNVSILEGVNIVRLQLEVGILPFVAVFGSILTHHIFEACLRGGPVFGGAVAAARRIAGERGELLFGILEFPVIIEVQVIAAVIVQAVACAEVL